MKNPVVISSFYNANKMQQEYAIYLFSFLLKKEFVTDEMAMRYKIPRTLKIARFFLQAFCSHKFKKSGTRTMQGSILGDTNYFNQKYTCELCSESRVVTYESEF